MKEFTNGLTTNAAPVSPKSARLTVLKARRKLWLTVHLWLGLSAGAVLAIIGLTGSIITFWQELDAVLNPSFHIVRAPPSGSSQYRPLADLITVADKAAPVNAKRSYIYYPRHNEQAFWFFYDCPKKEHQEPDSFSVFVDPYTAKVTGVRLWHTPDSPFKGSLIAFLFQLHFALLLDWDDGSWIVGTVGLLAIISVLTGLIVWWPLTGQWRKALVIKRRASAERFNHDLHKTFGFYMCVVLLGVLVSGVYFNFGPQFRWLVDRFSKTTPLASFHSTPRPGIKPLTLDQAIARAETAYPDGRWYWLKLPDARDGVYIFTKHFDFGGVFRGRRQIVMEQYSGRILYVAEPLSGGAGNVFLRWQWLLHSGQFMRMPGRILVLLSGFACALLFITGVIRWLQKQRAKIKHRGRYFV